MANFYILNEKRRGVPLYKTDRNNPILAFVIAYLCFLKFPYEKKMGYRTKDFKLWVCKGCFEDFKNEFDWTVSSNR